MENDFIIIGKNIRTHRLKSKITQKELAEKIGVSHYWVCKLENGKKNTTLKLLLSIGDVLKVDLSDLLKS